MLMMAVDNDNNEYQKMVTRDLKNYCTRDNDWVLYLRTATLVAWGCCHDDACEQWFGRFCIDWTKKEWVTHQLVRFRSLKWKNGPPKLEATQRMKDVEMIVDDDWSKWWLKMLARRKVINYSLVIEPNDCWPWVTLTLLKAINKWL